MEKITDKFLKLSQTLAKSTFFSIIMGAFTQIMTITIVGGFVSLFRGLDIGGYQAFLAKTGLYDLLGTVYTFTIGFLAVWVAFAIGYQVAVKKGMKKDAILVGLSSVASFFIVSPYTPAESLYGSATIPTIWLGATGMFGAIVIGFMVGYIYYACKKFNLVIKLPEEVPSNIARQLSALIPLSLVAIASMLVVVIFQHTPFGNIQEAVYAIVRIPLSTVGSSIFGVWVLQIFTMMMWFFGIHGGMTMMPFFMMLFTPLQMENLAAYQAGLPLPNWVTGSTISVGSGSFAMLVAMLIFAKSKQNRAIAKISIVPSIFGVDEPAYFGVPMIMNPIFFIPWVILCPTILVFGTYGLQALGLLGYATGAGAGSFVPFFVSNMVSYGIKGLIWGCIMFVICVLMYVPFVKAYDKQCLANETKADTQEKE